ncbi:hypothetical protein [Okeania sp.]|uniref:acyl carrier protein n=1 Tax=Okeania sp. TaxID=3100323 RepID=UPI002B4B2082|nr:hypothetical protein [Okeania sp.]MEB3341190.1 hypothetical protein [Okeania sp.]
MPRKITEIRENISNSNLVARKKFNLPSQSNIKIFNYPDQLEIILLNQLQTKNNQKYQYLLILLEKGNPKYTVYAEENETKKFIIYGYDEIIDKARNTQTRENISQSEFVEISKEFIVQYIQEEIIRKTKVLEVERRRKVEEEKLRIESEIRRKAEEEKRIIEAKRIKNIEIALEKSGRDKNQLPEFMKVQNMISKYLKVSLEEITLDSHLIDNLGLTTETKFSDTPLAKALKKEFPLEMEDNILYTTVGDLFDLIIFKKIVVKFLTENLKLELNKINLVHCKKFDLPSNLRIVFTHLDELFLVLLSQVQTKNNQEYPYLMLFMENSVPKYYVYSEEIEIEKEYGENIGGIPVGYRKEMIKAYLLKVYHRTLEELINSQIIESLEENQFAEIGLKLITKDAEKNADKLRSKVLVRSKILERVKKVISQELKINIERVELETSFSVDKLDNMKFKLVLMELQMALEKEFKIQLEKLEVNLPGNDGKYSWNVKGICDYICDAIINQTKKETTKKSN